MSYLDNGYKESNFSQKGANGLTFKNPGLEQTVISKFYDNHLQLEH